MLAARWIPYRLKFSFTALTSRQAMDCKDTYFIIVTDTDSGLQGVGECPLFKGLSDDDDATYEQRLDTLCCRINEIKSPLDIPSSSMRMGWETAMEAIGGTKWESQWNTGKMPLTINGLVWMGDIDTMLRRLEEKLSAGFTCIKIKIGALDFESELDMLDRLRDMAPDVELRLDANGAFSPREALHKIDRLARHNIHSLEQPVMAGQWQAMGEIARNSAIPIALDEEIIGCSDYDRRNYLLDATSPAYIITKPALCGGFAGADAWIATATERSIGWWATSALESNVGLHAIARWVAAKDVSMPQGLGTGQLYTNNIPSPLHLDGQQLWNDPSVQWDYKPLLP